ncbi:hypothetical protein AURDEDRAFT_173428 [Auricularia subglabra TFB-10046 SS5]|nr:hypothetical protein AURDEDRAFT_173428 [Auricularia subglabra TFB-10046 SS5]
MVRTRSGASSRASDDSVDLTRRKPTLGSLPSGDLDVPNESRVAQLTQVIAQLSPRKPGRAIFDLIDRHEAGDQSVYETPPPSPKPGEDVFEGLNRQTPPPNFGQAHEWKLGNIDQAAQNFEFYEVDPTLSAERQRRAFEEGSASIREADELEDEEILLPRAAQSTTHPEDVPLPEEDDAEVVPQAEPSRAGTAEHWPLVKFGHPTDEAYKPTNWKIVSKGSWLTSGGFILAKNGVRPTDQLSIPAALSGPKYFPPWFAYYFSADDAIRFEPWAEPQPPKTRAALPTPLRFGTVPLPRDLEPIVEEPESEDDMPGLMAVSDTSEAESFSSSYPPSFTDIDASDVEVTALDTGKDPAVEPVKGIPVWGPVGTEVAKRPKSMPDRPRMTAEWLASRDTPLTVVETLLLDKILRVHDGDGLDAAIAYVCNSQARVEPDLAAQWVDYLLDVRKRQGSYNPAVIRDFKDGKWPGTNPPPLAAPLARHRLMRLDSPPHTPSPSRKRPRATIEDWDDEEDVPLSESSKAKGKGVDPGEQSASTPHSVHFSPPRTLSPPPYQSKSSRVFSVRSFLETPKKARPDGRKPREWHTAASVAAAARSSPRADQAPPGGYYSESGGLGQWGSADGSGYVPRRSTGGSGGGNIPPAKPPAGGGGGDDSPPDSPRGNRGSQDPGKPGRRSGRGSDDGDYYRYAPDSPGGPTGPERPGAPPPGPPGLPGGGGCCSSSDNDGDDEAERREGEIRERRKIASQMKIKQPRVYDGCADLDVFDQWCFEVDLWRSINALQTCWAIPMLSSFLSDKAARFFMNSVIMSDETWNFRKLYNALFDHCFPVDFKLLLRKKFAQAKQGSRSVREFARDLKIMARRFPDIGKRQMVQVLFEGVHNYIRQKWHEFRYNLDENTYDELVAAAEHFEKRERARTGEDKSAALPARWTGSRGPADRASNWRQRPASTPVQVSTAGAAIRKPRAQTTVRSSAVGFSGRSATHGSNQGTRGRGFSGHASPQEPPSRVLAEGKCFVCKEPGHIGRNCPTLQRARRPTGVTVGSARILGDDLMRANSLQLSGMHLTIQNPENDAELHYAPPEVLAKAILAMFRAYYGDIYDRHGNVIISLERRFAVTVKGYNTFAVKDWAIGEEYAIFRSDFKNGNASVPQFLQAHAFRTYNPRKPSIASLARLIPDAGTDNPNHFPAPALVYAQGEFHLVDSEEKEEELGLTGQRYVVLHEGGTLYVRDIVTSRSYHITPEQLAAGVDIGEVVAQGLPSHGEHHARNRPTRDYRTLVKNAESNADFVSTTLVDQLKIPVRALETPIPVQLAVKGSRSKINVEVSTNFKYQQVDCEKRFDVANLDNYDLILGTPFLWQHQVMLGFNPTRVIIGSSEPREISGSEVFAIAASTALVNEERLEMLREQLKREAQDICKDAWLSELPPLRAINHSIPLIDEDKIYPWRPSRCPEAMRELWSKKKQAYIDILRQGAGDTLPALVARCF